MMETSKFVCRRLAIAAFVTGLLTWLACCELLRFEARFSNGPFDPRRLLRDWTFARPLLWKFGIYAEPYQRLMASALFGGIGAACVVAAARPRRHSRSVTAALVLLGFAVGQTTGVLGGIAGSVLGTLFTRWDFSSSMHWGIMINVALWSCPASGIGAMSALTFQRSQDSVRIVAAAIAGAALGCVVYSVAAALLFPAEFFDEWIPTGRLNQYLWIQSITGSIFCGIARALLGGSPSPRSSRVLDGKPGLPPEAAGLNFES